MIEIDKSIIESALFQWGDDLNIDILIEEMAELTHALIHSRRGGCRKYQTNQVIDETADVLICLESLKRILQKDLMREGGVDTLLQDYIDEKIHRLNRRLAESQ
jgi:NTP pyrophosphatase (non-canonical NTP hydrolase)